MEKSKKKHIAPSYSCDQDNSFIIAKEDIGRKYLQVLFPQKSGPLSFHI